MSAPELDGTRLLFRMLSLGGFGDESNRRKAFIVSAVPYAFFDDSGKAGADDFICTCGYLTTEKQWDCFVVDWKRALERWRLEFVHMTTFSRDIANAGWEDEDAAFAEFASIISSRIDWAFSVGVDSKHYHALDRRVRKAWGDADTFCFQRIVRLIRDRFSVEGYDGHLAITMDAEEGTIEKMARTLTGLRKTKPDLRRYISAITFADDKIVFPLQAADVLSNLTWRWMNDVAAGSAARNVRPPRLKAVTTAYDGIHDMDIKSECWNARLLDEEAAKKLAEK